MIIIINRKTGKTLHENQEPKISRTMMTMTMTTTRAMMTTTTQPTLPLPFQTLIDCYRHSSSTSSTVSSSSPPCNLDDNLGIRTIRTTTKTAPPTFDLKAIMIK